MESHARVSMCSCLACQRRTGAVISNQARFRREQITFSGKATTWTRAAESGHTLTFHFCPTCGSTVYWENTGFPGIITVAIGNFADPEFPPAGHRGVGRVTPPLGVLAARHTAQARCKAGVKEAASPLVESPCPLPVICRHCPMPKSCQLYPPKANIGRAFKITANPACLRFAGRFVGTANSLDCSRARSMTWLHN